MSLIDRCGAVHFLAMMYGRARASDVRCIQPLIIDKCGSESWRHSFIELGALQHKLMHRSDAFCLWSYQVLAWLGIRLGCCCCPFEKKRD